MSSSFGIEGLRIGQGFDVHQFCEGKPLIIGGVTIEHSRGLLGHSDADVLLHSIVDAILGALGEGDIGQHFSPSDPRWAGAASIQFIEFCRDRLEARAAKLLSVDSTLILEKPKMAPHIPKMRELIATALKVDLNRISVKATTTEKLGFTGREEGVAAQATALICLPD